MDRKGTVKMYLSHKGFGFVIDDEDETEYFFHRNNTTGLVEELVSGAKVSFDVGVDERSSREQAITVVVED